MPAVASAQDPQTWLIALVVVVAIGLRVVAFSPYDISHPDELMQYLEQGNRLVTGHGLVPWEYRYGIRSWLIPQMLAAPLWLGHTLAPGTMLGMYLARVLFAALCALVLPAAWSLGALRSRRHALLALFVAGVWFESVIFGELLLSESLASGFLLLGGGLILREGASTRSQIIAGFLIALGAEARPQYVVFAAVLVVTAVRFDWRRYGPLVLGAVAALLIGVASDLAMQRIPFEWIVRNFQLNIQAGRAAQFGVSSPLTFVRLMLQELGPLAIPIAIGAIFAGARYRPLLFAALANVVVHSMIDHKEYRFVWVSTLVLLILAAIASLDLVDRLIARRASIRPGLAIPLAMAAWLAADGLALASIAHLGPLRVGAPIPKLAGVAAQDPRICGIAMPEHWRGHVVTAMLPRFVPMGLIPQKIVRSKGPLPEGLMAGNNALLDVSRPINAGAYREIECRPMGTIRACLYIRPGGCNAAAGLRYGYQMTLIKEDF